MDRSDAGLLLDREGELASTGQCKGGIQIEPNWNRWAHLMIRVNDDGTVEKDLERKRPASGINLGDE
jgi:hypothetical protein